MGTTFPQNLSMLRHTHGMSQRAAAQALGISQALLSHYEKGIREPRLEFVARACAYYGVSADYILGITDRPSQSAAQPADSCALATDVDLATLLNAFSALADLANSVGRDATSPLLDCLAAECYKLFLLLSAGAGLSETSLSGADAVLLCDAAHKMTEVRLRQTLSRSGGTEAPLPELDDPALQLLRNIDLRIAEMLA